MTDQAELHNQIAGQIVASIIRPVVESGGSTADVMILTESVVTGVALACIKLGGDERVLDVVFERAKERLATLRLSGIEAQGNG